MLRLHEFQTVFRAAMLDGDEALLAELVCANGKPPADRLAIYRNNIYHNLLEALRDVYPVVERLVGEDFFTAAGEQYIRAHPSTSGDIHRFGEFFGDFLAEFPSARSLPYLGDTARLEWSLHEAFHAAEHPPLSLERLAAVSPGDYGALVFTLHPSCHLLTSTFPVHRIWQVNQPDEHGAESVDLAEGGVRVLIHRQYFMLRVETLTAGEAAMAAAIAEGASVATAFAHAVTDEPAFDLGAFLQRHVAGHVLVDFRIGTHG